MYSGRNAFTLFAVLEDEELSWKMSNVTTTTTSSSSSSRASPHVSWCRTSFPLKPHQQHQQDKEGTTKKGNKKKKKKKKKRRNSQDTHTQHATQEITLAVKLIGLD